MKRSTISPSRASYYIPYRLSFVAQNRITTVVDKSMKNRHRKGIWLVNSVDIVGALF